MGRQGEGWVVVMPEELPEGFLTRNKHPPKVEFNLIRCPFTYIQKFCCPCFTGHWTGQPPVVHPSIGRKENRVVGRWVGLQWTVGYMRIGRVLFLFFNFWGFTYDSFGLWINLRRTTLEPMGPTGHCWSSVSISDCLGNKNLSSWSCWLFLSSSSLMV